MKTVCISKCGQVKDQNEDSFVINHQHYSLDQELVLEEDIKIAAVFDGVGGANYGEVASKLAAFELSKMYEQLIIQSDDALQQSIFTINQTLLDYANTYPEHKGFATTIAGIRIKDDELTVFNVGDSRVYRFRKGLLKQYSEDDSYFNLLKSMGRVTDDDYHRFDDNHVITSYLGKKDLFADDVHLKHIDFGIKKGDLFLICTDGVYDMCKEEELTQMLSLGIELDKIALHLTSCIEEKGSKDNYSMILIHI